MKKILLILTAPFLLIDACSSGRLARREISTDKTTVTDTLCKVHELVSQSNSGSNKIIVVRELSNGEFNLSTRFQPEIKDHYRKSLIKIESNPE